MPLTPKQERFAEEYLVDLNAEAAARRAGYTERTARGNAHTLLAHPEVAALIQRMQAERSERVQVTADMVLRRWWDIATADANELVQYRRTCCRHCWGIDHAYQWTAAEFERAQRKAEQRNEAPPEDIGGLDFDHTRAPNPACPECRGEGQGDIHVTDTRRLKGPARLLYAGVRQGKDGLEVKLRDQDGALANVARHLGMFPSKVELTGKDGGPIATVGITSTDPVEAAREYQRIIGGGA